MDALSIESRALATVLGELGFYTLASANQEYLRLPDQADFDLSNGGICYVWFAAFDDWVGSGTNQWPINRANGTNSAWGNGVTSGGGLQVLHRSGGSNYFDNFAGNFQTVTSAVDGEVMGIRIEINFDDAGQLTGSAWYSTDVENFDPDDPINSVTWNVYETGAVLDTTARPPDASTSSVGLGVYDPDSYSSSMDGDLFYCGVWDGPDLSTATRIISCDFRTDAGGWTSPPGTDDEGNSVIEEAATGTPTYTAPTAGLTLAARIYQSDETTPLTDEVTVASPGTSFANETVAFTGVNTSANKAAWDGARIRFRWVTA
jgi:hypothetical protein